jgi:hypothetical protein
MKKTRNNKLGSYIVTWLWDRKFWNNLYLATSKAVKWVDKKKTWEMYNLNMSLCFKSLKVLLWYFCHFLRYALLIRETDHVKSEEQLLDSKMYE